MEVLDSNTRSLYLSEAYKVSCTFGVGNLIPISTGVDWNVEQAAFILVVMNAKGKPRTNNKIALDEVHRFIQTVINSGDRV